MGLLTVLFVVELSRSNFGTNDVLFGPPLPPSRANPPQTAPPHAKTQSLAPSLQFPPNMAQVLQFLKSHAQPQQHDESAGPFPSQSMPQAVPQEAHPNTQPQPHPVEQSHPGAEATSFASQLRGLLPSQLLQSASDTFSNITNFDVFNASATLLTSLSAQSAASDFQSILWTLMRQSSMSSPVSMPMWFHQLYAKLAQAILPRAGGSPAQDVANQKQLRSFYRRMLLIWKDILKSDIGNGNPLVVAVVTEWMRDLMPLQTWSTISYQTVNDMSQVMQTLLQWSQSDELCQPSTQRTCMVDPIRMQFAVELMRAVMPLVLMGQIKIGLIEKFLASFKRVVKGYPRVGYQVLGLMKANPPLLINSILHIFSNDGPDIDAIRGTSVEWSHSPDLTMYEQMNCVGASLFANLDDEIVDLCTKMFSNGHGANLAVKSVMLGPNSFLKLIHCPPDDPHNKNTYNCAGNMLEDCPTLCAVDNGMTPNCLGICETTKQQKMIGLSIHDCNNPTTVQCVSAGVNSACININTFFSLSYVWGKTSSNADDDVECPSS